MCYSARTEHDADDEVCKQGSAGNMFPSTDPDHAHCTAQHSTAKVQTFAKSRFGESSRLDEQNCDCDYISSAATGADRDRE